MAYTYTFELTREQILALLKPAKEPSGLFAGIKRKALATAGDRIAARHQGEITAEFSATGLRLTDASGGVRELSWAKVHYVVERPGAWSTQDVASGAIIIPASAVPKAERAALSRQLRAWVGRKYKVVDGGLG